MPDVQNGGIQIQETRYAQEKEKNREKENYLEANQRLKNGDKPRLNKENRTENDTKTVARRWSGINEENQKEDEKYQDAKENQNLKKKKDRIEGQAGARGEKRKHATAPSFT